MVIVQQVMLKNMTSILCDNDNLLGFWYPVARSVDVMSAPVSAKLLGRNLVVWRDGNGTVSALPDRCTHREAKLSLGYAKDNCLVCPYHGWEFAEDGKCVRVPSATEGVPVPPKAHIEAFGCEDRYGLIWVCIGEPKATIPDMPWDNDPKFRRLNTPVDVWKCSATRMVDNFLDITHFPFVHVESFGRAQETSVPKVELGPLDDHFFGYSYEVNANNASVGTIASGQSSGVVHRKMSSGFNLPLICRSTIEYDTGLSHILLLVSTPIDDVTSYFTLVVWRSDDFAIPSDEVLRLDFMIGAEDKRMLETFDTVLPLDQASLVSVQADKCSVEWRRQFAALLNG